MYKEYKTQGDRGELTPGSLYLYRTPHKRILNFPTKRHWRQRSRLDPIEAGLKTFVYGYDEEQLLSVAFPHLGCGNGQLDWEREVRPLMEQYLAPLPIDVYIHIYTGETLAPKDDTSYERTRDWLQSQPEARSASPSPTRFY
jgi:O-acetyl-ADP-ribose deacetylase (regulator of RNase III)